MKNEFKASIDKLKDFLPIAIVGMGLTGDATLKMLLLAGISRDQIKTFDEKIPADFSDPQKLIATFNPKSLLVSPGIPLSKTWIHDFRIAGGIITSELELASYFLKFEKVIAITGSVGKSTTTALIGAGASIVDPNCFVGGNFGIPLANYVVKIIQGQARAKYVILELSSFQLENYSNLRPDISILTYLSPNHMERYSSLEHYYQTKISLLNKTKDLCILNSQGGDILSQSIKGSNITYADRDLFLKMNHGEKPQMIGDHNLDNLGLSYATASYLKWPETSFKEMLLFPGLPHRLENCGIHRGILFLNDSKATAIASVIEAAHAVQNEKSQSGKIHMLLGGRDKNLPWENLSVLKNSRFLFHFFGEFGEMAQKKSGLSGTLSQDLHSCLNQITSHLSQGDIVLLSPGGTSLDEFKGFEDRGNYFKRWVLSEFNH